LSTKEIARAFLINEPTRWPNILTIDNALLTIRDDALARLNRAVALAEVKRREAALVEGDALDLPGLASFLPSHAVRPALLSRLGLPHAARAAYDAARGLGPGEAERRCLEMWRAQV